MSRWLIKPDSIIAPEESALRLLMFAACCLLVAFATVLFSIMTLMFYLGRDVESEDEKPVAQSGIRTPLAARVGDRS